MCNVALLDSVSMCMCPRQPACVHTHTHARARLPAYVPACTPVFVCPCRSIKFCSHSCRLVSAWLWSVCLPLNLQPLLLFHSLSSFLLTFSSASPCSASLCWLQLYLFFLTACLVFFFFFSSIFLPLSPDALAISHSELFGPPFFSFTLLSISRFTLAGFHLSAFTFLQRFLDFFFFDFGFDLRNIGEEKKGWWNMTQKLFNAKKINKYWLSYYFSFLPLDCEDGFRG